MFDLKLNETVCLTNIELLALRFPIKVYRKFKEPFTGPLPCETFKAVPGTNGYCEISDYGRVIVNQVLRNGERKTYLKKTVTNQRGQAIVIYKTGDNSTQKQEVIRLMMKVFRPLPDDTGMKIIHLDGNKSNIKLSNLKWATTSECHLHSRKMFPKHYTKSNRIKRIGKNGKVSHRISRFSPIQFSNAILMIKAGISLKKIGELLETTESNILYIKNTQLNNGK